MPDDFWPTYSAFANTRGGVIILGLKEYKGDKAQRPRFELRDGIKNPQKIRTDLFNDLNNRGKVSVNLLSDADVKTAAKIRRISPKVRRMTAKVRSWRADLMMGGDERSMAYNIP